MTNPQRLSSDQFSDWFYFSVMAQTLCCLLFWHYHRDGDYQPILMPLDEKTWRAIQH
jgi:hypothetical protein